MIKPIANANIEIQLIIAPKMYPISNRVTIVVWMLKSRPGLSRSEKSGK